jgi:hypothetical protein
MTYALQVLTDDPGSFRWVLTEVDGNQTSDHSAAECDFDTYADALNAGTVTLAAVDGQPYENEAIDPVGDADCAP